jgi:excinuclease ABC subunit C
MSEKYLKEIITKKAFLKAPLNPGVYIYWNNLETPIYVGKAKNLKNRLKSYQNIKLEPKTFRLMKEAKYFSTINVTSELESLLLEAKLVAKYKPKYNIQLKDDKHPLYIQITSDYLPIIKTVRRIDITKNKNKYFGPFPSSQNVKFILKFIRKIIPYSTHLPGKKACIYSQIGLCNPCPSDIFKETDTNLRQMQIKLYKMNIKLILKILDGNTNKVYKFLNKTMLQKSGQLLFEEANYYKNIIEKFNYISQPINKIDSYIDNPNFIDDIHSKELNELLNILKKYFNINKLSRIECFDIAHLMGQNPTASMVTFINGSAEKSLYRKFKVIQKKGNSDIDSMREIANRRLKHLDDWGIPDLIVVDGGKSQLNVFQSIFINTDINIIGLAKRFETIVLKNNNQFVEIRAENSALNLLQRIRDEAHRFARVYHHNLITKTLLGEI